MKFTKYNNPNRRRPARRPQQHSAAYIAERRKELDELLAKEPTEAGRKAIRKAFYISINP